MLTPKASQAPSGGPNVFVSEHHLRGPQSHNVTHYIMWKPLFSHQEHNVRIIFPLFFKIPVLSHPQLNVRSHWVPNQSWSCFRSHFTWAWGGMLNCYHLFWNENLQGWEQIYPTHKTTILALPAPTTAFCPEPTLHSSHGLLLVLCSAELSSKIKAIRK